MSDSETRFGDYLDDIGLFWDYERPWKTKRPDFTVYSDKPKKRVLAVTEVEDIDYSKEEIRALKKGKLVSGSFDPYARLRAKINIAREQLRFSKEFPCLLIVSNNRGVPDSPSIVLAAMLGDLSISVPLTKNGVPARKKPTTFFDKRGKMINPKSFIPQNTTISAVGLLNVIKPDVIKSGYEQKLSKLVSQINLETKEGKDDFFKRGGEIETELRNQGFDFDEEATSITFILNPYSRLKFPKKAFCRGYTRIFEYNLKTSRVSNTHDWNR